MLRLILALACFVCSTYAACDNHCSGHGTCGIDDVCTCYDNWGIGQSHDSGDCSERVCPYELAWVDTPDKTGKFHKYSECAGRGVCDRATGECQCFDGYEGKGCARTSCPNDCSGHGTCEYIDDFFFGATWGDYSKKRFMSDPASFDFAEWDAGKTRGCICDSLYGDVDCSKRMCQYGNDVMDHRLDMTVTRLFQKQEIIFASLERATNLKDTTFTQGRTFALTFKSKLNETFTTQPISFDVSTADKILDTAGAMEYALKALPNRVIDSVSVVGTKEPDEKRVTFLVEFNGVHVQGAQNLLKVRTTECLDG